MQKQNDQNPPAAKRQKQEDIWTLLIRQTEALDITMKIHPTLLPVSQDQDVQPTLIILFEKSVEQISLYKKVPVILQLWRKVKNLEFHLKRKHENWDKFEWDVCDKKFWTEFRHKMHMRIHSNKPLR